MMVADSVYSSPRLYLIFLILRVQTEFVVKVYRKDLRNLIGLRKKIKPLEVVNSKGEKIINS